MSSGHHRRSARRSRKGLVAALVPVVAVVMLGSAWAADSAMAGDVVRNVEVGSIAVGGVEADALTQRLTAYASTLAAMPVRVQTPTASYDTTAGELGLALDVEATAQAARDARRGSPLLAPFRWAASFVEPTTVDPVLTVDETQAAATVSTIQGSDLLAPVEPTITLTDAGVVELVPGQIGRGIDAADVVAALPEAVTASDEAGDGVAVIEVTPVDVPTLTSDATVQGLVDSANLRTAAPLAVTVDGETVEVPPDVVRSWLRLVAPTSPAPATPASPPVAEAPAEGDPATTAPPTTAPPTTAPPTTAPPTDAAAEPVTPALVLDPAAVLTSLAPLFPDAGETARNASVTLEGGAPVIVAGQDGTGCCALDSADRIQAALDAGTGAVELDVTTTPPAITADDIAAWGITQPVGGTQAWPVSRVGEVGPGFTTFHAAGEARVTNIHRIADLVRGAVIPPGGTFSVNEHVGRRTTANGFVEAGAIRNGEHVSEVGGGVSQFATTLFNAAYFAGLDITEYQAHSEYFSRYPRGREATMGFPAPDLKIHNTTPYGVLIWTSYTGSSLTVTLWSTPFASGEQTGISEGRSGNCTVVTTTRTRTYVDGRDPVQDTFRATYRPGPGQFC